MLIQQGGALQKEVSGHMTGTITVSTLGDLKIE